MKGVLVLCGLVMGLLLFEAFNQLLSAIRDKGPQIPKNSTRQAAVSPYLPSPWYHSFESANVSMHTVIAPFSEDQGHYGRHNSHGFRNREYTTAHPPNTFRIVAVGDSFTYGWGVEAEATYPAALERIFESESKYGRTVEVINLGIAGSRPADNFIRLLAHGESLSPDLVIFQLQMNDLEYSILLPYIDHIGEWLYNSMQEDRVLTWLGERSRAINALRKSDIHDFICALRDSEASRMAASSSFEMCLYRLVLASLAKWSKKTGTPVLFIAFPMIDGKRDGGNFNQYSQQEPSVLLNNMLYETLVAQAISYGFPVCDMRDVYIKKAGDAYLAVSENDTHPNAMGHNLAARALYEAINTLVFSEGFKRPKPEGIGWKEENALRVYASKNWAKLNADMKSRLEFFTALSRVHPKDPWITFNLAFVNEQMGQHDESRKLFESLIGLAPNLAMPWYYAGHKLPDDLREKYMKKALAILPDYCFALRELAEIYGRAGNSGKACLSYTRLARHPGFPANFDDSVAHLGGLGCLTPETVKLSHFQGLGDLAGPDGKMRFDTAY